MPLPQEVINRLSEDRPTTPGWSSGLLAFSVGLLGVVLVLYITIVFIYSPYVNNEVNAATSQVTKLSASPVLTQAASIGSFYSQIVHIQQLLANRVVFSNFLTWLQNDTQANTYYSSLSFSSGNQISLSVLSKSQADLNQQIDIFESDPNVVSVSLTSIALSGTSGYWATQLTLTLKPSLFKGSQP